MDIYLEFEKWLDNLLENNDMPENAIAFNFNLYEEEDDSYGIQLIASDEFDENDSDWACSEVWSSEEDIFYISASDEQDKDWRKALEFISNLICDYLENGKYKHILLAEKAIGVGFVDGDIDLLYKA